MAHHAYFVAGDMEAGTNTALQHIETELGLTTLNNPDVTVLTLPSFSIDDVRRLSDYAVQAATGDRKAIVIAVSRLFHEAQNAMLKLFEEPTEGTTLYLVVPSEGMLLPTLRSRLIPLTSGIRNNARAEEFLALGTDERKKYIDKLIDRSKSDRQEDKQAARQEALALIQELTRYVHQMRAGKGDGFMKEELLRDLTTFAPILHERSAPLKLIFEHLLLVLPDPRSIPMVKV